jgi:predicted patatin/cPLA2 family phospholipase
VSARYVGGTHPVLTVLRARQARGDRRDGCRVGLAVQGGGMRGVVSGAMLTALEDLGLAGTFDAVYGASSGAINAAYFLGGGAWRNLSAYYDELVRPEFVSLRRGMNLDFAMEVMAARKPLDFDRVLAADTELHVAVTRLDPMGTEVLHEFADAAALTEALRASAWLPVAVRGAARLAGRQAVDGAILTIHPYRLAVADGCTHVLSLSTKRPGRPAGPYSPTELVLGAVLERLRPGLAAWRRSAVRDYRRDRPLLRLRTLHPAGPPYLLDVAPPTDVPTFERDAGRLIVAARHAYEAVYRVLCGANGGGFLTVPRFTPVLEVSDAGAAVDDDQPGGAAVGAG